MSNEIHCCEKGKCKSERYMDWSLNCRICKNIIYIQCLREQDELRTKKILTLFKLMQLDTEDNAYRVDIANQNDIVAFNEMFNVDSIFGIICNGCHFKYNKKQQKKDDGSGSNQIERKKGEENINENHCESINTSKLRPPPPKTSIEIDNVMNDVYSIHVSKFHDETEPDFIVSHIIEHTALSPDVFKVEKLTTKRRRKIKYASFKIVTLTHAIYRTIIDPDIWSPDYTARRFEKYRNRKPQNHSKHYHIQKINKHQYRNKYQGRQNNYNNNNNNRHHQNRPFNRRHDNRNNKSRGKSWSNRDSRPQRQSIPRNNRFKNEFMPNHFPHLPQQHYQAPFIYQQQYHQPPIQGYPTLAHQYPQMYPMQHFYQSSNTQFPQ